MSKEETLRTSNTASVALPWTLAVQLINFSPATPPLSLPWEASIRNESLRAPICAFKMMECRQGRNNVSSLTQTSKFLVRLLRWHARTGKARARWAQIDQYLSQQGDKGPKDRDTFDEGWFHQVVWSSEHALLAGPRLRRPPLLPWSIRRERTTWRLRHGSS